MLSSSRFRITSLKTSAIYVIHVTQGYLKGRSCPSRTGADKNHAAILAPQTNQESLFLPLNLDVSFIHSFGHFPAAGRARIFEIWPAKLSLSCIG
jgi:hypothetical protein